MLMIRAANDTSGSLSNVTASVVVPGLSAPLNVSTSPGAALIGDWAYCTCKTDGDNGTLVYADRQWPSAKPSLAANIANSTQLSVNVASQTLNGTLVTSYSGVTNGTQAPSASNVGGNINSTASSLLQITLGHQRFGISMSDECECTNPWDNFKDPTGSAICSVNNAVNVCLIKVKGSGSSLTPDQSRQQALELLGKIDAEFMANNS
jgi:hypothetical protein